ncbi:MAG: isomerase [Proteobacteria bacterium]|nr:MAG: isomerase [Pseudomonadota bacterium]
MDHFVHTHAICESTQVGKGSRIWAFAHVLPGAKIGQDCNVCDHVFIENDVSIGNRVTIKCGVQVWDGVVLEDDVFVGPNVTFTNDLYPRSKQYPEAFGKTVVKAGASIGANATILPGISIGIGAMIGAGAVVTRSVPPHAVVTGNPGRITGYTNAEKAPKGLNSTTEVSKKAGSVDTTVKGVTFHTFRTVPDIRGSLSVGEFDKEIPFKPLRYFLVYDVPTVETRGEHAHHKCHQFLIAVKGSVRVVADDGVNREEFVLDRSNLGVYLPPMTWGIQYRYSPDAVLLVFASEYYNSEDYIRDYQEFINLVKNR